MRYLAILFLLISCNKYKNDYQIFSIKRHRSVNTIKQPKNNNVKGYAYFTESCKYELSKNIGQINKLIGLSNGINGVHKNSIRIGWEYDKVFKLYSYYYLNGSRHHNYITSVNTNEVFYFDVSITENNYLLTINDTTTTIKHNLNKVNTFLLYPYFGGKESNPNNQYIKIMIKFVF